MSKKTPISIMKAAISNERIMDAMESMTQRQIEDIGTTVPPASKNKPTQPKTYIRMSRIEGSSNIKSVGYSKRNKELAVRFKNGNKRYFYSGVPYVMYEEMLNAPSKGKFLNQNIKGKYPYQREYAYSDGGYMAKAAGIPMFIKMAAVMFAKNYDVCTQIA